MGRPVVHWEIGAKDADTIRSFYSALFDWRIENAPGMDYGLVMTDSGSGIDGGIMPVGAGVPPYLTFYVHVDDLQAYLHRAEALGGKTVVPPTPIPGVGAFAMFMDPEQHAVGLFRSENGS